MTKSKILPAVFGILFLISSPKSSYAIFDPLTNKADNTTIVEILKREPSLPEINGPTVVVGDIHGNLGSLVRCVSFFKNLYKKDLNTKILFLGDYVDKGQNSVECFESILELKLNYPNNVYLLRGNHEDLFVSSTWFNKLTGKSKTSTFCSIASNISKIFSNLSPAAIINDGFSKTFCVHGGITKNLKKCSFSKISSIKKGTYSVVSIIGDICPENKLLYKLLWNRFQVDFFEKDIKKFFKQNKDITRIVKGHDFQSQGYSFYSICHERDFCIIHSTEYFRGNLSGIGYIHNGKIDLGKFFSYNPIYISWDKQ